LVDKAPGDILGAARIIVDGAPVDQVAVTVDNEEMRGGRSGSPPLTLECTRSLLATNSEAL
jgi:hypothetical protein